MNVTSATTEDIEGILEVLHATGLHTPIDTATAIDAKIHERPRTIIVAKEGSSVIGTIFVLTDPWISVFYHLGVLPAHQGNGVGSTLLVNAERLARQEGSSMLSCYIKPEHSHLREFYRKRGWNTDRTYESMDKLLAYPERT